ncbi:MAG: choice-of-anchor tandem repeat GloVer-containing protein [Candidatus Cybelea sp.]
MLYRFAGGRHDGRNPGARLIDVNGTLYGTTLAGDDCKHGNDLGCGTVFSVSTARSEKVVHRFTGGADGWLPLASLIDHNGTLYGTTRYGGGSGCVEYFGCDTIYTISASGAEKVFYAFGSYANGTQPFARLIDIGGTLYGTTWHGGTSNNGTVFSVSRAGVETVLHSFGGSPDGALPIAGLINIKGTLYGTTSGGGTGCSSSGGCGTVFSISTSGAEKVLYSFAGGTDGSYPNAGLTEVNGTMYGTTSPDICCSSGTGWGTVYRVSTTGEEKVLHHFGRRLDGSQPIAGLINVKGALYGTTETGGSSGCSKYPVGCGTVYSISTTGTEKVLHIFPSATDGWFPLAGLTYLSGKLYGTTAFGGSSHCAKAGCGTVFALSI